MYETSNCMLESTAQFIASDNWKERFRAEFWQLWHRHRKLHEMTVRYEAGNLPFTPNCPLDLLRRQEAAMYEYLRCLEIRAFLEDIDIGSPYECADDEN